MEDTVLAAAEERWLPVVGYEGSYEVSDQGRVRSLSRIVIRSNGSPQRVRGRLLRPALDRFGYAYVGLALPRQRARTSRIHQLVLTAFVGPRPHRTVACHGAKGAGCNSLDNLRWGTPPQNNGSDKLRDGTLPLGAGHWNSRLTPETVLAIRASTEGPTELAQRFGVSPSTVCDVRARRTWRHLG